MKKLSTLLLLALTFSSCGSRPDPRPSFVPPSGDKGGDESLPSDETGIEDKVGKDKDTPLELIAPDGSALRFANGVGLSVMYGRVFGQASYGYQHCEPKADGSPTASHCKDSIFAETERADMGIFDLFEAAGRGKNNLKPATDLTLGYLRSLRAGLGRECHALVSLELEKLKAGEQSRNTLVRDPVLTAASAQYFLKKILGIEKTTITLPIAEQEYEKAFKQVLAEDPSAAANAFETACIALAMDPLVILY